MISENRKDLVQLNQDYKKIINSVDYNYTHSEEFYQCTKNIMNVIQEWTKLPLEKPSKATLVLGKTGWGKSTFINYVEGIPLKTDSQGHLIPMDGYEVQTIVGSGDGSTTLVPRLCQTKFGYAWDLPGDQDTGGPIAQLINSISKKNRGKIVEKIRLIIVIPESIFRGEGSYGKGLKDILAANNQFLKGINKYKENTLFVISYARRHSTVEIICQNIRNCLKHEDKALQDYKDLIQYIIKYRRIKLFPVPKEDEKYYTIPEGSNWEEHTIENILKSIKEIKFKDCTENDFSVPDNPKTRLHLNKFNEVVKQKIRDEVQKNAFDKIKFSGLEMDFVRRTLVDLTDRRTLDELSQLASRTSFICMPDFSQEKKELQFLSQFISNGHNIENLRQNWVNVSLNQKINETVDIIQIIRAENKDNFRKHLHHNIFEIRPNSRIFYDVEQKMDELEQLYAKQKQIQMDKNRNTSEFYETYPEKVFDRTVEDVIKIKQSYVEYEECQKKVNVPKIVEDNIPIHNQKVRIQKKTKRIKKKVPKIRMVSRTATQTIETRGARRFIIIGPRQRGETTVNFTYQTPKIYFDEQQESITVDEPIIQQETNYIKSNKVQYTEQVQKERIGIQKQRERDVKIEKNLFKDKEMERFNQQKFEQALKRVEEQISEKRAEAQELIQNSDQFKHELSNDDVDFDLRLKSQAEGKFPDLIAKWYQLEKRAFALYHPEKLYKI